MNAGFTPLTNEYLRKNSNLPHAYKFEFEGKVFIGFNDVFSPLIFEDSYFFSSELPRMKSGRFLEIGCGTGIISVVQAMQGAAVTACDISDSAIRNTLVNAILHGVDDKLTAIKSNVFDNINDYATYDMVFWNLPFIYSESTNQTMLDNACFSFRYEAIKKFFSGASEIIEQGGMAYYGFSSDSGNILEINKILKSNRLKSQLLGVKSLSVEDEPPFSVGLYRIIDAF